VQPIMHSTSWTPWVVHEYVRNQGQLRTVASFGVIGSRLLWLWGWETFVQTFWFCWSWVRWGFMRVFSPTTLWNAAWAQWLAVELTNNISTWALSFTQCLDTNNISYSSIHREDYSGIQFLYTNDDMLVYSRCDEYRVNLENYNTAYESLLESGDI